MSQIVFVGLAIVCVGCLAAWRARTLYLRQRFKPHGSLILQMECDGKVLAHLGVLTAADRKGKPSYHWRITPMAHALPHTQLVDLAITEIAVTQKRGEDDIVTISVIERKPGLWHVSLAYYWIRDAAIGRRPGFPASLLLPNNLILRFSDSLTDSLTNNRRP
jgi:hypothetical protein